MNASERLLALYSLLLLSGREKKLKELADEMGCSKQTIQRCIVKLEASKFGKLLCEKRGRESAYRLDRPKNLPRLALDAKGLQDLALCRAFLLHLLPEHMREQTGYTLQQASAYVSDGDKSGGGQNIALSITKGSIDYTPFEKFLEKLTQAIRTNKVCKLLYRATGNEEAKEHFFAPKMIIAFREALYARGWIVPDKGRVVRKYENHTDFAVQRLLNVELTERGSGVLPGVRGDNQEEGEDGFGFMGGEPFKVRVRFSPASATYAMERKWSRDQTWVRHRDGHVTLTMTARSWKEVLAWLLGFGDTAELLSPQWLREEAIGCLKRMSALYAKNRNSELEKDKECEAGSEKISES